MSVVNCNVANVAAWFAPLQHVVVLQVLKLMEFPIEGLTSASNHTTPHHRVPGILIIEAQRLIKS